MKKYYQLIQNQETREAEVVIFGDITSWEWLESDVSSYTLSKELAGLDVDVINVHINSYGGEVAEGLAIYNTLRRHPATVRTYCDGFACSAASVVFLAGDERVMNSASLLMIHNAWSYAEGNAEELRKRADDLETITGASVAAYLEYVNISEEKLRELMDAETWITPADALEMGFATAVVGGEKGAAPSQSARKMIYDRLTAKQEQPPAAPEPGHDPEPTPEPDPGPDPEPEEKTVSTFFEALCAKGDRT